MVHSQNTIKNENEQTIITGKKKLKSLANTMLSERNQGQYAVNEPFIQK